MNGATGMNPVKITASMDRIEAAYSNLMDALSTGTQTQFVDKMSQCWACKQAQDFFNESFKPAIDELLKGCRETFESVIDSMNSAAESWGNTVQYSWARRSFSGADGSNQVDVSCIQENIGDDRGAVESEVENALTSFNSIAENAGQALDEAINAVHECGFLDPSGNQEASLVEALTGVKNNILDSAQKLTDETKQAVKSTVETYGSLATNVSSTWSAS